MERRALHQAKDDIQQTKRTTDQLSKLGLDNGVLSRFNTEPLIRQLNSALGDVWGRIDIKHSCEEAARCASILDDALSYARVKRASVERELKEREFEMEEARRRLQKVREGIFERVMNEDMTQCPWDAT
jgi:chromosome condensin MukBEF ATPase and DNA-binding subunit MukB